MTPPRSATADPSSRVALAAAGAAGAASLAAVGLFDPGKPGNLFPRCPFHAVTGLWCPACGTLRAVHDVLHGHVLAGLGHNPLLVVVTPLALWAVLGWLGLVRRMELPRWSLAMLGVVIVAFTVLRNLPVSPFTGLAP